MVTINKTLTGNRPILHHRYSEVVIFSYVSYFALFRGPLVFVSFYANFPSASVCGTRRIQYE